MVSPHLQQAIFSRIVRISHMHKRAKNYQKLAKKQRFHAILKYFGVFLVNISDDYL